jgi:S-adenosylmethionine decarboxylase
MKQSATSFFEGTEKKVELAVDPALPSLRDLGRGFWERVTRSAGAQILSHIGNERCDAYLLSESSLFVFDHKFVLLTCGKTRPPEAVLEVLKTIPPERVIFCIYERKNEVFPHRQPTSFFDDVGRIGERLPGRAFQFGEEDEHHLYLFHLERPYEPEPGDVTTEILMYGLDERVRRLFGPDGAERAPMRESMGVNRILDGFDVEDHLFEPGGYSLNGIRQDEYWTVHVTPDEISSYASFETNARGEDPAELARRVVRVFRPRSFDLVLFDVDQEIRAADVGYIQRSHVRADLSCGYRVRFMSFYRPQPEVRRPLELPVGR